MQSKYFLFIFIITWVIIFNISCSEEIGSEPFDFNLVKDEVLGYDWWGQEDTWMEGTNLLSVYTDAIVFKSNDSIDLGYVGFGYGHHDLNKYYTTDTNAASYVVIDNLIEISLTDSNKIRWELKKITDTSLVINQLNVEVEFFLKFDL